MLNAVLLFATFYADRMIVAAAYDWATLALYGSRCNWRFCRRRSWAARPPRWSCRACAWRSMGRLPEASGVRFCRTHAALAATLATGFHPYRTGRYFN
jgi:hypothetical protein